MPADRLLDAPGTAVMKITALAAFWIKVDQGRGAPLDGAGEIIPETAREPQAKIVEQKVGIDGQRLAIGGLQYRYVTLSAARLGESARRLRLVLGRHFQRCDIGSHEAHDRV